MGASWQLQENLKRSSAQARLGAKCSQVLNLALVRGLANSGRAKQCPRDIQAPSVPDSHSATSVASFLRKQAARKRQVRGASLNAANCGGRRASGLLHLSNLAMTLSNLGADLDSKQKKPGGHALL